MRDNAIIQGSALHLGFILKDAETGANITSDDITGAEWYMAGVRKLYPGNGIEYDAVEQKWIVALTQQDTFSMSPGYHKMIMRIIYSQSDIPAEQSDYITVIENGSKAVLS